MSPCLLFVIIFRICDPKADKRKRKEVEKVTAEYEYQQEIELNR